jgi:5-methyltetrahydropteroyltriglutamate--homocysteine methyltransferase
MPIQPLKICFYAFLQPDFMKRWGLVREAAADIRGCLDQGAHCVQIDFTEGRLAVKLDPSGQLLSSFIALINRVLSQFSAEDRKRIGVHTCPGGDRDSTHSADVDYAGLLPSLFSLDVGNFYMQLASEPDRRRVLQIVRDNLRPEQRVFVGVIDPINPKIETPQEVRDRVLEASEFIPPAQLGTTDDCGFSPFGDDLSTARETAFAKIRARVEGTQLSLNKRTDLGRSEQRRV